jgi:hypothetical protein
MPNPKKSNRSGGMDKTQDDILKRKEAEVIAYVQINSRLKYEEGVQKKRTKKSESSQEKYIRRITEPRTSDDLILALRDPLSPVYKDMMNMILMDWMISDIVEKLIIKYLIEEYRINEKEKDELREELLKRELRSQALLQLSTSQSESLKQALAHSENLFGNINNCNQPQVLQVMYAKHAANIIDLQKKIDKQDLIISGLIEREKKNNDVLELTKARDERIGEFKEELNAMGGKADCCLHVFDPEVNGFREIRIQVNNADEAEKTVKNDDELVDEILKDVFSEPSPRDLVKVLVEAFKGDSAYKPEPRTGLTDTGNTVGDKMERTSVTGESTLTPAPPPPPPVQKSGKIAALAARKVQLPSMPDEINKGLVNPVFERLPINLAIEKGIKLGFKTAGITESDHGKHEQELAPRILEGLRANKPQVDAATKVKGVNRFVEQRKITLEMLEAELERKRCELLKGNQEKLLAQTAERFEKLTGKPIELDKTVDKDNELNSAHEKDKKTQTTHNPSTGNE